MAKQTTTTKSTASKKRGRPRKNKQEDSAQEDSAQEDSKKEVQAKTQEAQEKNTEEAPKEEAPKEEAKKEPITIYMRNAETGLLPNIEHKFDEFGFVDWKETLPSKYILPNELWLLRREKDVPKDPDEIAALPDEAKIISLEGFRWLAKARGYTSIINRVERSFDGGCVVNCKINWVPNYEFPQGASTEGLAGAYEYNTSGFAERFLESICENRAFSRCVRAHLNIPIVGQEELDDEADGSKESQETENSVIEGVSAEGAIKVGPLDMLSRQFKEVMPPDTDFVEWALAEHRNKTVAEGFEEIENLEKKDIKNFLTPQMARILIKRLKG